MSGKEIKQKLNRHQQRAKERFEDEAKGTFNRIAEKFLKIFTEADLPLSQKVEDERKRLDAQWRIYCKRMNLVPAAYTMFTDYSLKIVQEFKDKTKPAETQVQPTKRWYQFWK